MRIAVFADAHAQADATRAVMAAAVGADVRELWSLGDLVGSGPDPAAVVGMVRSYCAVALAGNHDHGATGAADPARFGAPDSLAVRSLDLAVAALAGTDDVRWLRSRRPAARRHGVQCWHGSPRHPVREYVTAANAAACLLRQRASLGLVGHTHAPAAWRAEPAGGVRAVDIRVGEPLELGDGKWLLNPGAAGAPVPPVRGEWWAAMDAHARAGAWWLELDLGARVATWRRAPYDPGPALARARSAGLVGPEPAAARPAVAPSPALSAASAVAPRVPTSPSASSERDPGSAV